MAGIFDMVQQQLGGGAIQQIAEHAGIDPSTAQQAVTAAIPMILGGMAQHASQPGNAQVIHQEADKYAGHAGVLGDLPNVFTGQGQSGGLLGKIVGDRHQQVHDGVAQAAGINTAQAAKVVAVVAPVVLGALAMKKRSEQLSPNQVQGTLQQEQQQAQQKAQAQSPGLGGLLGSVMGSITGQQARA